MISVVKKTGSVDPIDLAEKVVISVKGENADPRAVLSLLSRFKNKGSNGSAAFDDPNLQALLLTARNTGFGPL